MKLTLQLRLLPDAAQAAALLNTIQQFNKAAAFAARIGFDAGVFSKPSIHRLAYRECRNLFGLSAQMAVLAISKAADAFSCTGKEKCPEFRSRGAMTYDERIISFKDCHRVSILAVGSGRLMIPYVFGEYQRANLARIRGQCDLVYRDKQFFLYCTIDFEEQPPIKVSDFLGIDLGIVNLAADSDGETFSGATIDRNRRRRATARKQHQRKGTKGARRKLKRMAGRQANFQRHENHRISKRVVSKAKALGVGIALENLTFLRNHIEPTVSKRFRRRFGNWGFCQLRKFIEYKGLLAGIPVVSVDPKNTSRTCSECGSCRKANRKSQDCFECQHCGYSVNADFNAARNIRAWATHKLAPKVATIC